MTDATRRFAAGAGWLYGYRWLERLLDFVAVVVLARILSPDDFGLVAIVASIVSIIEGLSAFDVNKALIRHRDEDRALYDTAWTLSALRGTVAALVMVAIAPFLADPRMSAAMYALAAAPLLTGLANPRFVAFERDLVYSRLAVATLVARVASVAVTLTVAVVLRNYWALILGILVASAVSTLLSYALKPYRPRVSLVRFADIFAFSGWLSLTSVVTTLSMETDRIIVGRLLGVAEAGLYYMTRRIGVLPTRELISPLQRILFPSFSSLADEPARLRRVVVESINVLGSLSLPAGFGFALVANDFVPLVLGPQWGAIIPLLTVLVPYLGVRATLSMALPCAMALGRTRLLFEFSLIYGLVHLPAFVAGTALFGLMGAVGSLVLAGAVYVYLNTWLLKKTLDLSLPEILSPLRRPVLATVLMVGTVVGLDAVTPVDLLSPGSGSWPGLVAKAVVGGAVYLGALSLIWHGQGRPPGIERRLLQVLSR